MTFDPFLPCLASSSSIKSKYVSLFVPEKVSDYIRGDDETLSVRPIFGPLLFSHGGFGRVRGRGHYHKSVFLHTGRYLLACLPYFLAGWLDVSWLSVSKWLLHQMWTFELVVGTDFSSEELTQNLGGRNCPHSKW